MAPEQAEQGQQGRVKAIVTKRIGPLPVWGYVVIGAGAIGVLIVLRKRNAGKVAASPGGLDGVVTGSSGGGGGGFDTTPTAGSIPATSPGGSVGTPTPPTSGIGGGSTSTPQMAAQTPTPIGQALTRQQQAIQNAIAGTIQLASQQVDRVAPNSTVRVDIGTNSTEQQRQTVAAALVNRGYTASSYGGTIYAARTPSDYFAGLPTEARNNLARLLVAQSKAA